VCGVSLAFVLLLGVAGARSAFAQTATPPPAAVAPPTQPDDDPAVLDPVEPDYVVVNLPTTLRVPKWKGNFRLTHRFAGNLMNGDFGYQLGNLFGIDQGAIIGFEYRMGLPKGVEAAAFRTSFDKTIQLYTKWDGIRQKGKVPVAISPVVSIEGVNNFQDQYAMAYGASISRSVAQRVGVYAQPFFVTNTAANLEPVGHTHDAGTSEDSHEHRNTFYVGLGARIRLRPSLYATGEFVPRVDGYSPNDPAYGFGVEARVGQHVFSLTFTNTFSTTFSQLARGGTPDSLYLGFNLARKFF
jgi:hypothetical protein